MDLTQNCLQIVDWLKSWFTPKDEEYHYGIVASDYNPSIDSTVTITVRVTDGNDTPVTNHSFTLDVNGTNVSLTTDQNGEATYNYTCSLWGICRFSIQSYTAYINVTGWKTVQTATKFTAKSNGRMVSVRCSQASNTGNVGTEYDVGTLISGYRPQNMIVVPTTSIGSNGGQFGFIRVNTDGEIKLIISRSTYSASGGMTLYGTVEFGI